MKYYEKNGRLCVSTKYNEDWVKAARNLGGRWNATEKEHRFPMDIKEELENALFDFFGYGSEKVNVEVHLPEGECVDGAAVYVGTRCILKRYSRDSSVSVGADVSMLMGKFDVSGGSAKHPSIGKVMVDCKLRVRNVPKNHLKYFDDLGFNYSVVEIPTTKEPDDKTTRIKELIAIISKAEEELAKLVCVNILIPAVGESIADNLKGLIDG